jgi:transcriptional regulator with XRE-family HTH domain
MPSFAASADTPQCISTADAVVMDVIRFGLGIRALRLRRRLTQANLAARSGVSRSVIGRIERGRADRVAVHTLVRVAAELGARVDVRLLWQGEGLDRLLDARHADLVERVVAILTLDGWDVAAEISFNLRGERGSIDILAFRTPTGSLLVVEVKSVVPDLQAMLSGLNRKARLAPDIARERGWRATSVSKLLVLPHDRTARRRVESHAATFQSSLPGRSVEIRRWFRQPTRTMHGVLFVSGAPEAGARHRASSRAPIPGPGSRSRG